MSDANVSGCSIAAVRGAITVPRNDAESIVTATARLLTELVRVNRIRPERVVSALFTATPDLDADFPAHAARRLGWNGVPLLCAREIAVPGAMPRVVRVLLTLWSDRPGGRLAPVYLDGAAALRPDLHPAAPGPAASTAPLAPAAGGEPPRRVAIIGLGQIGGSIALALGREEGWRRVGFDIDPATLALARAAGAIDQVADSLAGACADAELAVLAVGVDALPGVIDSAAAALPRGAALIDTGSARAGISEALARAAARGVRAVGGHPIAGGEGRGFAAARADLFERASFALHDSAVEIPGIVMEMIRALGARPIRVSPPDHDQALARTSHLPYMLACALRDLGEGAASRGLSGPGFRDMTRLAGSEPGVATAYCRANATEVAAAWRELRAALDAGIEALGRG